MIMIKCTHCGLSLRVDEKYAGKTGRCKQCGNTIYVPENVKTLTVANQATSTETSEILGGISEIPINGDIPIPKPVAHSTFKIEEKLSTPPPPPPTQRSSTKVVSNESKTEDSDVQWFYCINGKRIGPVTEYDIKQFLEAGTLNIETLLWRKGFDNWIRLGDTTLIQLITVPPPLTGIAVNNGIIWIVAFLPIIGTFIEYFIAGAIETEPGNLWFITLALNIGFCFLDERVLKNAGHDTKKFGGWIWLIPVYLFKRAKALNQSLAYFITWIICFALILFA